MSTAQSSFCTLPKLVQENSIRQFSFFAEDQIHTGMSFDHKLYILHHSFRRHKRTQAFALASSLAHQGAITVITVSPQELFYRVWLDLQYVSCLNSTAALKEVAIHITSAEEADQHLE